MLKAMLRLIFILPSPEYTFSLLHRHQFLLNEIIVDRQYFDVRCEAASRIAFLVV